MIKLHRLNGSEVVVNAELIETIDKTPDTLLHLATGNKILARESVDEVVEKVIEYKKTVYADKKAPNPIEGFVRK